MVRNITYCFRWNQILSEPIKPYAAAKAEKRHRSGEPYCAVIETETGDKITIDCASDSFYVLFFDSENRRSRSYTFKVISDQKLFLRKAWFPQYFAETNEIESAELYYFKENGDVKIVKGEPKGKNRSESDKTGVDVEKNYAEMPSFGNYESIITRTR